MGTYILKSQIEIAAAHALRGYPGDCARVHGHNWKINAEVKTAVLDDLGIGIDFKDLKREMRAIADVLDHQFINEIEPFTTLNPTAENIAAWFYKQLAAKINNARVQLTAIDIFETDRSSVRYSEVG
jgi:6-pyruvoyltetrahydropterin/6-carboxytetrahydropterin synthase